MQSSKTSVIETPPTIKSKGSVRWFDNAKGFGFILNQVGEDIFVHYRSIQKEGYKSLKQGDQVTFNQVKCEKGWLAEEVFCNE